MVCTSIEKSRLVSKESSERSGISPYNPFFTMNKPGLVAYWLVPWTRNLEIIASSPKLSNMITHHHDSVHGYGIIINSTKLDIKIHGLRLKVL